VVAWSEHPAPIGSRRTEDGVAVALGPVDVDASELRPDRAGELSPSHPARRRDSPSSAGARRTRAKDACAFRSMPAPN
jgi:hypothetical protein